MSKGIPQAVTSLGTASSFVYNQGVICALLDGTITIYDSSNRTANFSIRLNDIATLTSTLTPRHDMLNCRLVHYSDKIVSLSIEADDHTRTRVDTPLWDRVYAIRLDFDHAKKSLCLGYINLATVDGIFVRNDSRVMYVGAMAEPALTVWQILLISDRGFRPGLLDKTEIMRIGQAERDEVRIGSNLAFEIFNGYCYVVTSVSHGIRGIWERPVNGAGIWVTPATDADVNDEPYKSYSCAVFSVGNPAGELTKGASNIYRRELAAGSLQDNCSNLKIIKDEKDGQLKIVETRQEYVRHASLSVRSFYTTEFWLPEQVEKMKNSLSPPQQLGSTSIRLNEDRKFHAHRESDNVAVREPGEAGSRSFIHSHRRYGTYELGCNTSLDIVADYSCSPAISNEPCLRIKSCSRTPLPGLRVEADFRNVEYEMAWTLRSEDNHLSEFAQRRLRNAIDGPTHSYSKVSLWPPDHNRSSIQELAHEALKPTPTKDVGGSSTYYKYCVEAISDERMLVVLVSRDNNYRYGKLTCLSFDGQVAPGTSILPGAGAGRLDMTSS